MSGSKRVLENLERRIDDQDSDWPSRHCVIQDAQLLLSWQRELLDQCSVCAY